MLFLFFSGSMFSQSLSYSAAESLLDDAQMKILKNADKFINRAEKSISDAARIEDKYEKFKVKKKKKYDKKTAEAKKLRIEAERNYLKAYQDATEVWSKVINDATFYNDNDRNRANALNEDALDLIDQADNKMKSYNSSIMDSKALKTMPSSSVLSACNSARNFKESAFNKQKQALDLVMEQNAKKEKDEADNRAWQTAQDINTIAAYQDYINNNPDGKYVSNARQMIQMLEEEAEKDTQPDVGDYKFQVQIAASRTPLSTYELRARYSNTGEIDRVKVGSMFKYRVGEFYNYADAAKFRDQLTNAYPYKRRETPFVVVFDKSGNQIEVTDSMKQ
jgi:hypothetical protein